MIVYIEMKPLVIIFSFQEMWFHFIFLFFCCISKSPQTQSDKQTTLLQVFQQSYDQAWGVNYIR